MLEWDRTALCSFHFHRQKLGRVPEYMISPVVFTGPFWWGPFLTDLTLQRWNLTLCDPLIDNAGIRVN